ncbi:MAG: hypothetical protein ACRCX2_10105 [Paraclostridium sp.]
MSNNTNLRRNDNMNNITQVEMLIFDIETNLEVCKVKLPQIPEINSKISLYGENSVYTVKSIEYACDNPYKDNEFIFDTLILWCEKEIVHL